VHFWQTPSFLFLMMGVVIVVAMVGIYFVASSYDSAEVLIISEATAVVVLFTIGNFIIRIVDEIIGANRMKTEFVSVASHQLKTPLAEINWQIELLLSKFPGGLSEKQQMLIGQIAHSSQKMSRLVNDLLDVARIDRGKLAMNKEDVDLCKTIAEAVANQRPFALASGVELRLSCPITSPRVLADKKRLTVVLDNIISNAVKYTKSGGVAEIFLEAGGGTIQVCIRDNGIGIPAYEQHDIFKKFFRGSNAMKNNTDGTGLGLYIAKNIIEQLGGRLWFQSVENVGSEFFFILPIIKRV